MVNGQYSLIILCNEHRIADYKDSECSLDCLMLDDYDTYESYLSHFLNIFNSIYD